MTSLSRSALAFPTTRRALVLGTGRASQAFLRNLDPKIFAPNGGRLELVVASPREPRHAGEYDEDVRSLVMKNGTFLIAEADAVNVAGKRATLRSVVSGDEFDVAFDALVVAVGCAARRIPGADENAYAIETDRDAIRRHLRVSAKFADESGDARFFSVAVLASSGTPSRKLSAAVVAIEEMLDFEFAAFPFVVKLATTEATRIHSDGVVAAPSPEGNGLAFSKFGTVITVGSTSQPRKVVRSVAAQIGLADGGTRGSGLVVDGFQRVVGARGVYAIGSAAFVLDDSKDRGDEYYGNDSEKQGALLADHFRRGMAF